MTRVSKKQLKKEVSNNIRGRFSQIVADLKNPKEAGLFLSDLLSDVEEVMLAKRLAIIVMLKNRVPFSAIEETLKVSPATISKISNMVSKGKNKIYSKNSKNNKNNDRNNNKSVLADLEVLLRMGMPPIVGKGRWKALDEYTERKKYKK